MRADGLQEKPLQGAVVCCTSIPPERRSQYAEYVCQLGAEHKLDLTSDVTHLIVGDTDTPKYKYVAKEREDVKVLQPEWIDAVRKQWMADDAIDVEALEMQYRVPTLAGLKICITGFDDLKFRAQLQKNVEENGGQYTGDLTKDVTHLIANNPSGKKYEYGTQWQKKIVSLRWYQDTLRRGMQLEESAYHPTIPVDEQGAGAWNKLSRRASPSGVKRPRDDSQAIEQPRKLRRTASARFNSQNETMWSDITGKEEETGKSPVRKLQVSRSVPNLKEETTQEPSEQPQSATIADGIFNNKYFVLEGFSAKQAPILRNVLTSHGGTILDTISALQAVDHIQADAKILLLPYQTALEQVPLNHGSSSEFQVASELWVEHCMFGKTYQTPHEYELGRLLPQVKSPGFSKLVISSTGFFGIVPNHIAKIVRLLGATYEQTFKSEVNLLLCNSQARNHQKVDLACRWQIPVVTESWLWASVRDNRRASFEVHKILSSRKPQVPQQKASSGKRVGQTTKPGQEGKPQIHGEIIKHYSKSKTTTDLSEPGAACERTAHHRNDGIINTTSAAAATEGAEAGHQPNNAFLHIAAELKTSTSYPEKKPLQPLSPNSSPQRRRKESPKRKKRLFQPFDGACSDLENGFDPPLAGDDHTEASLTVSEAIRNTGAQSLNSEIRQLLDLKSKSKEKRFDARTTSSGPKKQLMGRALSNLSNASSTSHVRQSRAGSIDSVNTDGLGSEIGPAELSESKADIRSDSSNNGFVGRASSKLFENGAVSLSIMAASIADGGEEEWATDEPPAPALTQLVYEDPEEAIQLREKLAAKRRQRSKLGQKDSDPKPEKRNIEPARIKDDDVYADAGWGAGRRTRQRNTSLSKEF